MCYEYVSSGNFNFVQLLYTCQQYQHYIIAGFWEGDNIRGNWSRILQFKPLTQII